MSAFAAVWALVRRIPRGQVATYGQLSQLIDRRLTPVGIGWAVRAAGENEIPWQRVVNSRGGISTDDQHLGLQRSLLEAEGVRFRSDGTIDLERYGWRPRASATVTVKKRKSSARAKSKASRPRATRKR